MKPILLPFALVVVASIAPALAQPLDGPGEFRLLRAADLDGDGAVSRQELMQARIAHFDQFDRNGDGFLDGGDMPPIFAGGQRGQNYLAWIAAIDGDGDGRVSWEELAKGPTPVFDAIDGDGNDLVTAAELSAAR